MRGRIAKMLLLLLIRATAYTLSNHHVERHRMSDRITAAIAAKSVDDSINGGKLGNCYRFEGI